MPAMLKPLRANTDQEAKLAPTNARAGRDPEERGGVPRGDDGKYSVPAEEAFRPDVALRPYIRATHSTKMRR